MAQEYEVLVGLDHPKGRLEPGDKYDGPAKSISWLIECGAIAPAGTTAAEADA